MVELINNQHVTVRTSREHQLVEVIWMEHCESATLRDTLSEVMAFVREQGVTKWLCDMRLLQYMLLSDQNWLTGVLLPTLPSREQFRFAYLISLTQLELMSSLGIQDKVQRDPKLTYILDVEIFLSREQALLWLS